MEKSLFYTQFSPLNAGNRFLGFASLKFPEGACSQTPLENVDCWYSRLLYTNLLAILQFLLKPLPLTKGFRKIQFECSKRKIRAPFLQIHIW